MAKDAESFQVFISYARRDASAFAEELRTGLEVAGFDALLDRHDIAAGEDWEARLGGLIQATDTVVFVITPAAVASERCLWEVSKAEELSKRIIPVVLINVDEAKTPLALRRLNYIFFGDGHSYSRSLADLASALRINLTWLREHTRLSELARRWHARDRTDALLLRGSELGAARDWLGQWRPPAPEPTDVVRALLDASEAAEGAIIKRERERQRTTVAVLSAILIVFVGLAATLGWSWQQTSKSYERARQAQAAALEAAKRANAAREDAVAARSKTQQTAARSSFYEGLYWLAAAEVNSSNKTSRRQYLRLARMAFLSGMRDLGPATLDMTLGFNLSVALRYGEKVATECLGEPYSVPAGFLKLSEGEERDALRVFQEQRLAGCPA